MIKKIIILLFICPVFSIKAISQSFMHGIGANISIIYAKINTPYEHDNFTMEVNHFSYFPRFNLSESENTSFSVGFPLGAGVGILTGGGGSAEGVSWGFELPVAADYNFGCGSTPDNEKLFGGYFGGGFSYMYTAWNDGGETSKANSYGPVVRGGMRFGSSRANWKVTIGLFFKVGLETTKYKTFGFNILSDL